MPGNNRVFVSHSHDDNERCAPLLATLDAWGVQYWFDVEGGLSAGQHLTERVQQALATHDVFLRICTGATQRSFWMSLETSAFRGLIAEDMRTRGKSNRVLLNLILSGDYSHEPFDNATIFIDAASRPRQVWMGELARALGISTAQKQARISRRELLGYGAAAAVTLTSTAAAGALYLDYRSRSAAAASASALQPGKIVWQLDEIAAKKNLPALPATDGDTLYVMTGSEINARTLSAPQHVLWRRQLSTQYAYNGVTVVGDTVYTAVDKTIYAFKASDGSKRLAADLPATVAGYVGSVPQIAGDSMYVLTSKGTLCALNASNGSLRWSAPIEPYIGITTQYSTPVVDGNMVFTGSLTHSLYAFDTKSGKEVWRFLTHGSVVSTPRVANGVVYFGSSDNYVYALDAHNGSPKWKFQTGNDVQSTPNVSDGVVFIASNDRFLYALDAATGTPYWRAPVGDLDKQSNYVTGGGNVYCQPTLTRDAVCIVDDLQHALRCYNRKDGTLRWKYQPGSGIYQTSNPLAVNNLILFGSGDQNLYAFGA